jgi:hypothetical protein
MVIDQQEAAAALASMRDVKGRMAKGPRWGWKYHLLFGGVMASLFMIQALPLPWRFVGLFLCFVGVLLIKKWGRDASGRFINGFRRGRTRMVAVTLIAVFIPFYLWCAWLSFSHRVEFAPIYGGLVIFPVAVLADWVWVKAYDADLAEGR